VRETEFAQLLIPYLAEEKWEIYPEFSPHGYGGAMDFLAVRGKITWSIEVKTTFNLHVIDQAIRNMTLFKSVFVPASKSRTQLIYNVAKQCGIGVLEYPHYGYPFNIREMESPKLFRNNKRFSDRYLGKLTEEHRTYAEPGTQNGSRLTPYRQSMNKVKQFIASNDGVTVGEIFEQLGKLHYSSKQSFRTSLLRSLRKIEKWPIEKDGKFYIDMEESGRE